MVGKLVGLNNDNRSEMIKRNQRGSSSIIHHRDVDVEYGALLLPPSIVAYII